MVWFTVSDLYEDRILPKCVQLLGVPKSRKRVKCANVCRTDYSTGLPYGMSWQ